MLQEEVVEDWIDEERLEDDGVGIINLYGELVHQ
jgi:hypothetical protein